MIDVCGGKLAMQIPRLAGAAAAGDVPLDEGPPWREVDRKPRAGKKVESLSASEETSWRSAVISRSFAADWLREKSQTPAASCSRPESGRRVPSGCHENLDLEQPVKDKVYEFAYVYAPLRLKGATGSPGNPIAVK